VDSKEDRDFRRWYGRWASVGPSEIADVLAGAGVPWWIVGGWAIDAATGHPRPHHDMDVGFLRADLPTLLAHLARDYCVWSNASGTLRPLRQAQDILPDCRQLWVRRDAASPWLIDLAMTPHDGTTWISPRDDRLRLPLDRATFTGADGVRYLRPEVVLHMKARHRRPEDEQDFERTLPLLVPVARAWLTRALTLLHPGHPWLDRLDAAS
jgi:Aminoglycoside-2''-adenylyltransferase